MFISAQIVVFFSFIEHFFYVFVCYKPGYFAKSTNPPQDIHRGLMICKALQAISLLYIYDDLNIVFNPQFVVGIVLISLGQLLNISAYNAIGFNGIYYGIFFGEKYKVPWFDGFPYNLPIKHPQYIGAYVSYIGLWMCAYNVYDGEFIKYSILMAISYIFLAIIEDFQATPK